MQYKQKSAADWQNLSGTLIFEANRATRSWAKMAKKILFIEDDIFLRKLYRDQLARAGYEFLEATNGVEGLNKAESEKPDLILLDLLLPRKSGFEVLKELKGKLETKDIPVIIFSVLGQEVDIKEGFDLGAEDYFVKTEVRPSDVIDKIKRLLK